MNAKKRTRIFALMREKQVFIGRSSANKLSAVVYSHCRGEHLQTLRYFDLNRKRPDLYVLAEVEDVSPVTYRHWLAWIHAFEVEGYEVLNREDVLEDSRDLHPETRQIYERIRHIPLELHLEFGYCTCYSASDFDHKDLNSDHIDQKCTNWADLYAAAEKLSIRLSKQEKEVIAAFAKSLNLSLRDALLYAINRVILCDDTTLAADQQMYSLRERYTQNIQQLKAKNTALTEHIKKQHQQASEKLEKNRKQMDTILTGIQKYISYLEPDATIPLHIEQDRYRNYIRDTEIIYEYPQEEGFAVIRPHAILWGSTQQVRFLVGETDHGEHIKLRYYPSKHFVGIFPANDQFGLRGSCWLVGWERKEENVMQLNFSLPLSVRQKYDNPMAVGKS